MKKNAGAEQPGKQSAGSYQIIRNYDHERSISAEQLILNLIKAHLESARTNSI